MQLSFSISELSQTQDLAQRLASLTQVPLTIALDGDLGAGKTQCIRFFAEALGVPREEVTSPTYVLLQRYAGNESTIHHFDFYRLESEAQVWDLGIDELYEQNTIVLIEWASKFPQCLPSDYLHLQLINGAENERRAELTATGEVSTRLWLRMKETGLGTEP